MDFDKYAYVISAPNRKKVVIALDRAKTPTELAKELEKQDANISRTLKELTDKGIIVCLTPKKKRGRIYSLTKIGYQIRKILNYSKH